MLYGDARRTMSKENLLSERGPRNTKLTVLIPAGLLEDLKALRMATCQSTGDLVNELLEAELRKEADAVAEGKGLIARETERQQKAKARMQARRDAAAEQEAPAILRAAVEDQITMEDVQAYLATLKGEEARRQEPICMEYVKWCIVEGRKGDKADVDDYKSKVLLLKMSRKTAVNHKTFLNRLVKFRYADV